jgi:iron-sulfur cluster assembly protein
LTEKFNNILIIAIKSQNPLRCAGKRILPAKANVDQEPLRSSYVILTVAPVYEGKEIHMEKHIPKDSAMTDTASQSQTKMDVHLTTAAVAEIKRRLAETPEKADRMLRLRVQAGGCSGLSYDMDFVTDRESLDREFEFEGLKVLVDARSLLYIGGMTLDFSERLVNGGFQFSNPRAKRSCGCGTSFSV